MVHFAVFALTEFSEVRSEPLRRAAVPPSSSGALPQCLAIGSIKRAVLTAALLLSNVPTGFLLSVITADPVSLRIVRSPYA